MRFALRLHEAGISVEPRRSSLRYGLVLGELKKELKA
jgi:hypothetical protein